MHSRLSTRSRDAPCVCAIRQATLRADLRFASLASAYTSCAPPWAGEKRLDFENAKIVSNFLSRPVPFRPRRNVRKRGSLQSDVCARWVVVSHLCHCQGVAAVHCPGSRHELASLPCRPYMHFQRTHMWKPWRFSLHPGCSMELLRAETLLKAFAAFISYWAQHGPPEDRDTCKSLSGFHFILGAAWA